jgi:hypothetical protein
VSPMLTILKCLSIPSPSSSERQKWGRIPEGLYSLCMWLSCTFSFVVFFFFLGLQRDLVLTSCSLSFSHRETLELFESFEIAVWTLFLFVSRYSRYSCYSLEFASLRCD